MWNAFRDAASKIGDEMASALDGLTETNPDGSPVTPATGTPARATSAAHGPSEEASMETEEIINTADTDDEAEHEADRAARSSAAQEDDEDFAAAAAENITKWFSSASSEVTKVVNKVEEAVEKSVDAFHDFVEAKKTEARRGGVENTLIDVADSVDSLNERLEDLLARHSLPSAGGDDAAQKQEEFCREWASIAAGLEANKQTLEDLLEVELSDEMTELTTKQLARVSVLLDTGCHKFPTASPEQALVQEEQNQRVVLQTAEITLRAAATPPVTPKAAPKEADEAATPTPAPTPPQEQTTPLPASPVVEATPPVTPVVTTPIHTDVTPAATPTPEVPEVAETVPEVEQPTTEVVPESVEQVQPGGHVSSESEEELAQANAESSNPEDPVHVDPVAEVVPATPTPTLEIGGGEEPCPSPSPTDDLVHVQPPNTAGNNAFEWDDKW